MTSRLFGAVVGSSVIGLFLTGCSPTDSEARGDEDVGAAQHAQVDPGMLVGKHLELIFADHGLFAEVLVMNEDSGRFRAGTEYWYVQTSKLQYLGVEGFDLESTDIEEEAPALSGDQYFEQPVSLTWNSFTSDPVTTGELYTNSNLHLRIGVDSGEISRLTWYQLIVSSQPPVNINPQGAFTVGSGSVTIPSSRVGYYIDATID